MLDNLKQTEENIMETESLNFTKIFKGCECIAIEPNLLLNKITGDVHAVKLDLTEFFKNLKTVNVNGIDVQL